MNIDTLNQYLFLLFRLRDCVMIMPVCNGCKIAHPNLACDKLNAPTICLLELPWALDLGAYLYCDVISTAPLAQQPASTVHLKPCSSISVSYVLPPTPFRQ